MIVTGAAVRYVPLHVSTSGRGHSAVGMPHSIVCPHCGKPARKGLWHRPPRYLRCINSRRWNRGRCSDADPLCRSCSAAGLVRAATRPPRAGLRRRGPLESVGMPRSPLEPLCPHCGKPAVRKGLCAQQAAALSPRKINSRRWNRLREAVFAAEPLCRSCSAAGRVRAATEVDHIVPVVLGGGDSLSNLQGLLPFPC